MDRKCSYPDCRSTEGLHPLPPDPQLAHRWLQALGRFNTPPSFVPPSSVYVCYLHFTRENFSNYGELEMEFKKQLLLNPDSVPTSAHVVPQGTGDSFCQTSPAVRHVASQTDPPEIISDTLLSIKTEPLTRRSVGTQLSKRTLQNPVRSTATQARVPGKDCGVCTPTFPLDSPLLLLQPTIVKRPPKRPRLSLSDEEEGPSEGCSSMGINEPGNST
ncbi:uncharacterized protein [Pseudochaenichthys georgianus]|uniref:uncharacterized protein n=1 Tax=Pseudochaenichthys georgianus TaxID=52239 RepID=UPI00146D3A6D|nr:uncharacterized protein LOC117460569 isoform X2 [Pseudochaenichthys georgianus]